MEEIAAIPKNYKKFQELVILGKRLGERVWASTPILIEILKKLKRRSGSSVGKEYKVVLGKGGDYRIVRDNKNAEIT